MTNGKMEKWKIQHRKSEIENNRKYEIENMKWKKLESKSPRAISNMGD
jgi:hypothetical protein